ncbi:MAG: hypothetical protein IPP78_09980 [Holophagaceae bacterium]|nr:hypothetical protein [Holophagaceae bacterium]
MNVLRVNQTYSVFVDVVFVKPVHKPIVDLETRSEKLKCEITVSPFMKSDYQAGERERITFTVKPMNVGKDVLSLTTGETDSDGDTWSLDGIDNIAITVEE